MTRGLLGQMVTPDAGNCVTPGAAWALDNGCFNARWTPKKWLAELDRHKDTPKCLFAVVPDVVADAEATDAMWRRWVSAVRRRGYRCAYVAQDGCGDIPADAQVVFLGGTTEWKLGADARAIAEMTKASGRWLHMGRVNTLNRLRRAVSLGCDSVDGTVLAYGPDKNLPILLRFLQIVASEEEGNG